MCVCVQGPGTSCDVCEDLLSPMMCVCVCEDLVCHVMCVCEDLVIVM